MFAREALSEGILAMICEAHYLSVSEDVLNDGVFHRN